MSHFTASARCIRFFDCSTPHVVVLVMPVRDVTAVGIITDGYRTASPDKGSTGGSGIVYLRGLLDSFLQRSLCHFVLRATQYEGQTLPHSLPRSHPSLLVSFDSKVGTGANDGTGTIKGGKLTALLSLLKEYESDGGDKKKKAQQ